ncbi:LacI family DNA-binding transcriptional regulator [Paenibacillus roseipurpureus]|uniref:LacI family DNA-binding transcriptional regulator n=1 Tax=Paenibacillus roseopurpureus TaxID=2918901 RepID=A0AA96LQE1_9BACL|nr:LacI family DNA-binding transcriptional regulator [Paenibacillus sp. MBLB1832]WNR45239.1 LacI family DNA-binding transcriptional regulator [Paenibacillus sp. MBLB1832]
MKTTMADLAKHLGISEATVSLALNDKAGVSPRTKKKVQDAAKSLGYTPNFFARGLATQKSSTIGLIVPEVENPFYSKLTQSIEELVRASGRHLILGFSDFSLETEQEVMERFANMNVDGIMVSPVYIRDTTSAYRDAVRTSKVPIIYVGAYYYDFPSSFVMTNLMDGSFSLTEHLLSNGYRNIVFLCGQEGVVISKEREIGFRSAYAQRGLSLETARIIRCDKLRFEEAFEVTKKLLLEETKPDAIITVNDIMALGAMRAVRESGLQLPKDVAVAGYDDVIFSSIAEVPLTTVRQPVQEMAQLSVDSLLQLISEDEARSPIQLKISPQLVLRQSTLPI